MICSPEPELNSSMIEDDQSSTFLSNDGSFSSPHLIDSNHSLVTSENMVQAISDSCHADDMKLFSATVTAKWKNILRREKYASLQEEGSSIKEYYQQELQRKDDLIQQLLDRCVQSEDLSKAAYTSYIENLQNIILSMESQLQTSYGDFTTTVKELFEDFRFDCDHIDQSAYKHVHEYQDNIKRIELHEQEDLDQQALHCESIIDDIETKASYEMESIRSNLDAKIEDLEDKLTTASTEFLKRTDCTSEELKMLVSQGEALSSELKQTKHSIHDLKRSIHNLKKYSELDSKNGLELSLASVHQKDHTTQRYQSIKEELVTSRKAHGRKLKTLALQAHNYKTELSKRLVKLERIVKQGHLFFPFKENKHPSKISVGQDTISVEHDTNDGFFQRSKNIVPPTASSIKKRLSNLDLHLQRCNCIKNELKCLKKEENHLQIRKEKLKVQFKKCRDGQTINDNVLAGINPLIIINGKMGEHPKPNPSINPRRQTVIDGPTTFMANQRLQAK